MQGEETVYVFEEAVAFAVQAHKGMVRKAGKHPYILHPMEAAVIVGSMTDDPEVLAAAVLHDVVEDANVTLTEIRDKFGERVMDLVASETEYKRVYLPAADTWQIRKNEAVELLRATDDIGVKMLYLGDKLSNLRSISRGLKDQGEAYWQQFNQTDPKKHHWYYRAIAEATQELSCYGVWQEFDQLIYEIFEK